MPIEFVLAAIVAGIALLLVCIIYLKIPAFPALLLTSILVGLLAGLPPNDLLQSIKNGMGGTLGFVAIVVGLGAMFGRLLEVSGGIGVLATTLLKRFGESKAPWALGILGFIVAIPVFFDVGFVILVPLIAGMSRKSGRPILYYAIPLLAGLAVTHSFIPPTPGPIAVADLLGADLGWVILFGALAGLPAMIIAGPLFGKKIAEIIPKTAETIPELNKTNIAQPPGFWLISGMIALPLLLILLNTVSTFVLGNTHPVAELFSFIGHPFIALLIATLLIIFYANRLEGYTKESINAIATAALEPAGIIILVTGAGGVFKQVLIDSGAGKIIAESLVSYALSPIFLAFIIAAIIRVVQGSATVAMITAAGLLSPILAGTELSAPQMALVVIAISAGATILSHVNDSGFWLVSRFLNLDERETIKSWTVMTTLIGVCAFISVYVLSLLV
ncbi:MAG: GntP family permease [Calditrichia bacterium]